MKALKKTLFTLLGLLGLLSLMCSIAATCVTNGALIQQGFLDYGDTKAFGLSPTQYGTCAANIAAYLNHQTDAVPHPNDKSRPLFSEDEMLHLSDVRGLVSGLKAMRWAGGGLALAGIALAWLLNRKEDNNSLMPAVWQGFAWASGVLFTLAAGLCIWALIDFESLFLSFHRIAFSNDLWLMDPKEDLMIALMPEQFFMWYGIQLVKSLLPIFGIMLCLIISWLKVGKKETEGAKETK